MPVSVLMDMGKIALCPSLYSAMWKVVIALLWGNTRWVSGRIASGESIFIINYMDWKRRMIMLSSGISVAFLYSVAGNRGVSFASSVRNQSRVSCNIR